MFLACHVICGALTHTIIKIYSFCNKVMKFCGLLQCYFMTWRASRCNQEQVFWMGGRVSYVVEWISAVYILCFLCLSVILDSASLDCSSLGPHCKHWNVFQWNIAAAIICISWLMFNDIQNVIWNRMRVNRFTTWCLGFIYNLLRFKRVAPPLNTVFIITADISHHCCTLFSLTSH